MDLKYLAKRCRELEGPDRATEGMIFALLHHDKRIIVGNKPGRFPQTPIYGTPLDMLDMLRGPGGRDAADYLGAPNYTTSLDAASALMPNKAEWNVWMDALKRCSIATSETPDDFAKRLPAFLTASALEAHDKR